MWPDWVGNFFDSLVLMDLTGLECFLKRKSSCLKYYADGGFGMKESAHDTGHFA
jgi:hypothetical protein